MKFSMVSWTLITTTVLAIPQQLATITSATTGSTEVTATTSMSSITPGPAVMEDLHGKTFTCFTEGHHCSRDAFGGVGDHLPENQSANWWLVASEAMVATTYLPIPVTTVTEPCHAYKNNALKCAPDDAIIRSGTGSISIPTALPLQGGFALPGSCKNFPDWQHAVQCQGATTTTMTLTPPTATRTMRPTHTAIEFFVLNLRLEFQNGSRLGYLAEQQIEGSGEGVYNLTLTKGQDGRFHRFHLDRQSRLRGLGSNGVDLTDSHSQLQWYHERDTYNQHDGENDPTREVVGPLPIILMQESVGFTRGSLGQKYEEIWGQIEWDVDTNMIPLEKLKFDSWSMEDNHPYKQLLLRNNVMYIATRRWAALFKAGELPKDKMDGWELVIAGAEPWYGKKE